MEIVLSLINASVIQGGQEEDVEQVGCSNIPYLLIYHYWKFRY